MSEQFVCKAGEIPEGERRIVELNGIEIGVYRQGGRYYAYRNYCLHQGGPACEGELLPKVVDVLGEDQIHLGQRFEDSEMHIVCPWHGWEFKLENGECATDAKQRLKCFNVIERGDAIYVDV